MNKYYIMSKFREKGFFCKKMALINLAKIYFLFFFDYVYQTGKFATFYGL